MSDKPKVDNPDFDYRAISAASSQQILMSLDKSLKSYFFLLSSLGNGITKSLPVVQDFRDISTKQKAEMYFLILMRSLSTKEILFSFQRKKDYCL